MTSLAVAVFGGTFDPVHLGHIRMAENVFKEFNPDKLIVLPNGNPPHKADKDKTAFEHRYNMLVSAFGNMEKVEISDYEADTSKHSYSVDTMRYFRKRYGEETFFVLGADSLLTIDQWYKYEELLSENTFVVFRRKGDSELLALAQRYRELYGTKICIASMPYEDISSTDIRSDIGGIWDRALSDSVKEYIISNGLYTGYDSIAQYLKTVLKKSRFEHTMRVAHTARRLADLHGEDRDKAYLAGLLHDCAKGFSEEELRSRMDEYGIVPDEVTKASPQIWHSFVGAYEARKLWGVDDDIFDAIYFHTTGNADMTRLCAIVYLADAIEPGRSYTNVDFLRKTAEVSLSRAVREYTKMSVEFVEARGLKVHPDTLAILNRR